MVSPNHIRANEYRCQLLFAEAARVRLIQSALSEEPIVARPSQVSRVLNTALRVLALHNGPTFARGNNNPSAA